MAMAFYATPKTVLGDKKLTPEARLLFAELLDKMKLSMKPENRKGFTDKEGRPFVRMAQQTMACFLGKSLPTVRKALKELAAAGLIAVRRVGLTCCNIYYIAQALMDAYFSTEGKDSCEPDRKDAPRNKNEPSNTDKKSFYKDAKGKKEELRGKYGPYGHLTAQQYTQREYTREELNQLIEVI